MKKRKSVSCPIVHRVVGNQKAKGLRVLLTLPFNKGGMLYIGYDIPFFGYHALQLLHVHH